MYREIAIRTTEIVHKVATTHCSKNSVRAFLILISPRSCLKGDRIRDCGECRCAFVDLTLQFLRIAQKSTMARLSNGNLYPFATRVC
jgi:hypothetical protein